MHLRPHPGPSPIRAAREQAGKSREEAAVAVGRSYSTMIQYEIGRWNPPPEVLARLAELYGVTVEDLRPEDGAA
jgi:transcriptional regulator with XRE-family HTH domain